MITRPGRRLASSGERDAEQRSGLSGGPRTAGSSNVSTIPAVGKQTTFDYPDDLQDAQRTLEVAQAARFAFLASAPKWVEPVAERILPDGTVVPAEPGWDEEQRRESHRLLAAEQEASLVVWAHPFWESVQRAGWPGLEADQQDLLIAIGVEPDAELAAAWQAAEAWPKTSCTDRFQQRPGRPRRVVKREGHVRVPRPHKEPLEVAVIGPGGQESTEVVHVGLGAWLNNQKAPPPEPWDATRERARGGSHLVQQ
ncbi:hypothetical protein [Kitasatospora sp. KL5]|uniref:hypothetical protein n=1 Tax=Kitasatospora sp. KL5 TaxID=3425125 RepID=UPI003D6E417B